MKDKFYEEIVFTLDDYNNDRELMWADITKQLQILARSKYVAKIYADDYMDDIMVIQFHYQDEEIASGTCPWITWDQIDSVLSEVEDKN